ncbi:hypothetical protein PF006_g30978, partial [Phytophthora fragariae]
NNNHEFVEGFVQLALVQIRRPLRNSCI